MDGISTEGIQLTESEQQYVMQSPEGCRVLADYWGYQETLNDAAGTPEATRVCEEMRKLWTRRAEEAQRRVDNGE